MVNKIKSGIHLFRSWERIYKIPEIKPFLNDGYFFCGYQPGNERGVQSIYSTLNNTNLTGVNLRMFNSVGNKVMVVVIDTDSGNQEVAMNMYYLNPRDFKEKTIHEGFIGVMPEHQGKGIASQMRKLAIKHFKKAGFKGISTRISKNNLGSLRSAEKLGFKPVEEYYDETMNETRYYLVCDL